MISRGCRLKPRDLLAAADSLLEGHSRPKEALLRRAQSSIYYAAFHCLAKSCADGLIGGSGANRRMKAWLQTYRALSHQQAKNACMAAGQNGDFSASVVAFARLFVDLQRKRHSADYDPAFRLAKSDVLADSNLAYSVIEDFEQAPVSERRALAALALFPQR